MRRFINTATAVESLLVGYVALVAFVTAPASPDEAVALALGVVLSAIAALMAWHVLSQAVMAERPRSVALGVVVPNAALILPSLNGAFDRLWPPVLFAGGVACWGLTMIGCVVQLVRHDAVPSSSASRT